MHRLQEQIDRPTTKRNAAMTEVTTSRSAESRHDAHRDVRTRTRHLGDHALTGASRGFAAPATMLFDPTRGREPQASMLLDPTRGREVHWSVSVRFDPTRGRELHESSANLLFMPTHGHEDRAALAA